MKHGFHGSWKFHKTWSAFSGPRHSLLADKNNEIHTRKQNLREILIPNTKYKNELEYVRKYVDD